VCTTPTANRQLVELQHDKKQLQKKLASYKPQLAQLQQALQQQQQQAQLAASAEHTPHQGPPRESMEELLRRVEEAGQWQQAAGRLQQELEEVQAAEHK
jgi:hypothetical protein